MKKFKIFLRFDKEEKWLEEMAGQGWLFSGKFLLYHFQKVEPEVKTIRIDYRGMKSREDFLDYCTLFEDSGWQHIAGTLNSGTQYFLKVNEDSTEDIFSDGLSKAGRYKRLSDIWLFLFVPFLTLLLSMETGGFINPDTLFTPKEWYLTPGLWELEGFSFWWAFLFETPFALERGLGWLLPIIAILLSCFFGIKSWLLYRSEVKSSENRNRVD